LEADRSARVLLWLPWLLWLWLPSPIAPRLPVVTGTSLCGDGCDCVAPNGRFRFTPPGGPFLPPAVEPDPGATVRTALAPAFVASAAAGGTFSLSAAGDSKVPTPVGGLMLTVGPAATAGSAAASSAGGSTVADAAGGSAGRGSSRGAVSACTAAAAAKTV